MVSLPLFIWQDTEAINSNLVTSRSKVNTTGYGLCALKKSTASVVGFCGIVS